MIKKKKSKEKQEEKIKELCKKYKSKHPDASDVTVLNYAFTSMYGKMGTVIVKKLLKDPNAFSKTKEIFNEKEKNVGNKHINLTDKEANLILQEIKDE